MQHQDDKVYLSSQIRLCEQVALQHNDLTADELMLRAGTAAFAALKKYFTKVRNLVIFCGSGNNAGDGFVLARLAHASGYTVSINLFKPIEDLPDTARHAALQALADGVSCYFNNEIDLIENGAELIIDALLGIGLQGELREPYITAINHINDSDLPVMALDIPSGLNSDTGVIMGVCVYATLTLTFIGKKIGMLTLNGPDVCGYIILDSLQIEKYLYSVPVAAGLLRSNLISMLLPPRVKNCHKGQFGHVLMVGGNLGMPGSIFMAAQTCLRVGAGVVTIATHPQYAASMWTQLPESMVYGIDNIEALQTLLARATVCLIGPGLGEDEWAQQLFNLVMASHIPMVIDASALRLLAINPQCDDNWVLTPHPGEAARLLNCQIADIQNDRYHAALSLQQQYGGTIVLKGIGSLVRSEHQVFICDAGNPGMASPGMGDYLSGIIAGLIAQKLSLIDAAKIGVLVHAMAADLAVSDNGERGLLATDLPFFIRKIM